MKIGAFLSCNRNSLAIACLFGIEDTTYLARLPFRTSKVLHRRDKLSGVMEGAEERFHDAEQKAREMRQTHPGMCGRVFHDSVVFEL